MNMREKDIKVAESTIGSGESLFHSLKKPGKYKVLWNNRK